MTIFLQQAIKRMQERKLAAKNELLMRRLHDIYAEDEQKAWNNVHKVDQILNYAVFYGSNYVYIYIYVDTHKS